MSNTTESKPTNAQKSASASTIFVAGAVSGLAEALSVQPFDMIKTRHHLNQERHETIIETMKQVYREGGFLRFYRGTHRLYGDRKRETNKSLFVLHLTDLSFYRR